MHKITNNSIKNRGSNLILNKSGRGPPKKHQHQICNKSVHRFNSSHPTPLRQQTPDSQSLLPRAPPDVTYRKREIIT